MTDITKLIDSLLEEYSGLMQVSIPDDYETQRAMLRSLIVVLSESKIKKLDDSWIAAEAEYLKAELTRYEVKSDGIECDNLNNKSVILDAKGIPTIDVTIGVKDRPKYLQRKEKMGEPFSIYHSKNIAICIGDITKINAEAITNSTDESLLGVGETKKDSSSQSILLNAGVAMKKELLELKKTGSTEPKGFCKATKAYALPAEYVMHTVAPTFYEYVGDQEERELKSCYSSCLQKADELGLKSIAFPFIATGSKHFPKAEAAGVAFEAIDEFFDIAQSIEKAVLVAYSEEDYKLLTFIAKALGK